MRPSLSYGISCDKCFATLFQFLPVRLVACLKCFIVMSPCSSLLPLAVYVHPTSRKALLGFMSDGHSWRSLNPLSDVIVPAGTGGLHLIVYNAMARRNCTPHLSQLPTPRHLEETHVLLALNEPGKNISLHKQDNFLSVPI